MSRVKAAKVGWWRVGSRPFWLLIGLVLLIVPALAYASFFISISADDMIWLLPVAALVVQTLLLCRWPKCRTTPILTVTLTVVTGGLGWWGFSTIPAGVWSMDTQASVGPWAPLAILAIPFLVGFVAGAGIGSWALGFAIGLPLQFGVCLILVWGVRKMFRRNVDPKRCECGYSLTGLKSARCPECGRTVSSTSPS